MKILEVRAILDPCDECGGTGYVPTHRSGQERWEFPHGIRACPVCAGDGRG